MVNNSLSKQLLYNIQCCSYLYVVIGGIVVTVIVAVTVAVIVYSRLKRRHKTTALPM